MFIVRIFIIIAIAATGFTQAASLNDAVKDCGKIKRDLKRLACFDSLSDRVNNFASEAMAEQTTAPETVVTTTGKTSKPSLEEKATTAEDNFGLPDQSDVDAIYSSIPGEFKGWRAGDKIKLANGQIWQVSTTGRRLYHKAIDPRVEISKGSFGSHIMKVVGLNASVKVKRLK